VLAGGRAPHAFLRAGPGGAVIAVERFEPVRPDASVVVAQVAREPVGAAAAAATPPAASIEVLVERDDRLPAATAAAKLRRYDHMLSGWGTQAGRLARARSGLPVVVFLCRSRARARECARAADAVVVAGQAYAGEYPADWMYPGRNRILFAAERDAHEGCLDAYGLSALPPAVRRRAAGGDPHAQAAEPQLRPLPLQAGVAEVS
jgi:hypothetical protein